MQNSDLKNVLIAAIETADSRLLSMLYAVTKSYQITSDSTPVTRTVRETPTAAPTKATSAERVYKDERPRRVVRIYRKPKETMAAKPVQKTIVTTPTAAAAPRIIRVTSAARSATATAAAPAPARRVVARQASTYERSNNGGFISDLMTKTV